MTIPADHLSQLMLEFYEKMASWEHSVVKQTGLSPAQMHTIEMIGHHQSLRMKELASRMGITTGTLTVMIDRLEKAGLVVRQPNANDRRSFHIVLTGEGRRHFEEHHQTLGRDHRRRQPVAGDSRPRVPGLAGPVGLRQDHDHAHDRRP